MCALLSVPWLIVAIVSHDPAQKDPPLVDALRARLVTAEAVAKAKHNSGAAVEDKRREKQVLDDAVHKGVSMALDGDTVLTVFKAQIEANKVAQRAFLKVWASKGPFKPAPNLAKEVRPQLDKLTPIILRDLKRHERIAPNDCRQGPQNPIYKAAWKAALSPFQKKPSGPAELPVPSRPPYPSTTPNAGFLPLMLMPTWVVIFAAAARSRNRRLGGK